MEERIKMNKRKIVSTIAAAMMVTILSTASVLAETQTEKPTYSGKTVTCVLSCDFSLFGNEYYRNSGHFMGRQEKIQGKNDDFFAP